MKARLCSSVSRISNPPGSCVTRHPRPQYGRPRRRDGKRLRLLSHLCANGPARPPAPASALGAACHTVLIALNSMQDCGLVASHPSAIVPCVARSRAGGVYALGWDAAEDGRKYLWLSARVTGKLNPRPWCEDTWNGRIDTPPWDVLAQHAQPSLFRPAHLAIACWLRNTEPTEKFCLAEILGLPVSTVHHALQRWAALGRVGTESPRPALIGGRFAKGGRTAVHWTFNRAAYAAMDRYVHALRWAGQSCGYTPPNDDPFLNHTFCPGWIQVTFE